MRILFVHNAYRNIGGEDAVVQAEMALLAANGHQVQLYHRHNDELYRIPAVSAAANAMWSRRTHAELQKVCDSFAPDLIHAHNLFPLISPSLYWTAARRGVPTVQTLHNFRLLCPQGTFLRDGRICEACLGKVAWRAAPHRCYRNSFLQSAVSAGLVAVHRKLGSYARVTRYIALSEFSRSRFVQGGLAKARICVKPNFVASQTEPAWEDRHGGLFVGRISVEKGIDVLIAALQTLVAPPISVIGGGPHDAKVKAYFQQRYLGFLAREDILQRMRQASFLLVPSIGYEHMPMTIVEAFSCGLPVIASRLAPLLGMIENGVTGLLFNAGDAIDLASKVAWALSHPQQMLVMGRAARAEYLARYTPGANYTMLTAIYQEAILELKGASHVA